MTGDGYLRFSEEHNEKRITELLENNDLDENLSILFQQNGAPHHFDRQVSVCLNR